jgi:hypothetical protein
MKIFVAFIIAVTVISLFRLINQSTAVQTPQKFSKNLTFFTLTLPAPNRADAPCRDRCHLRQQLTV